MVEQGSCELDLGQAAAFLGGGEHGQLVPGCAGRAFLGCLRRRGRTDEARDEHAGVAVGELLHFDAEHFGGAHLFVQELDDPDEFVRKAIGDEHHADVTGP